MNRVQKRLLDEIKTLRKGESIIDTKTGETIMSNKDGAVEFHGKFSAMTAEQQDQVINPKHYKILPPEAIAAFPDGMEYMDIMRYALAHMNGVLAHVLGQIFKYAFRVGKKDEMLQDATKIAWYANRLVEEIKAMQAGEECTLPLDPPEVPTNSYVETERYDNDDVPLFNVGKKVHVFQLGDYNSEVSRNFRDKLMELIWDEKAFEILVNGENFILETSLKPSEGVTTSNVAFRNNNVLLYPKFVTSCLYKKRMKVSLKEL